jgi:hypothetical protein
MQERVGAGHDVPSPDTFSYSHTIVALARTMNKDTARKLVEIVDKMELYEKKKEALLDNIGKIPM